MNGCMIIGNLTRDPETRYTQDGIPVCSFTVAVGKRKKSKDHPEADFFRVTAWRQLGEACQNYLKKGKKVYVRGIITSRAYTGSDGVLRSLLELTADEVEFLTPRDQAAAPAGETDHGSGYEIAQDEELPF